MENRKTFIIKKRKIFFKFFSSYWIFTTVASLVSHFQIKSDKHLSRHEFIPPFFYHEGLHETETAINVTVCAHLGGKKAGNKNSLDNKMVNFFCRLLHNLKHLEKSFFFYYSSFMKFHHIVTEYILVYGIAAQWPKVTRCWFFWRVLCFVFLTSHTLHWYTGFNYCHY